MNPWVLPLGLLCGLVLGATGLSVFALWRAYHLLREVEECAASGQTSGQNQVSGEVRDLRQSVETLAAKIRDLERHPPVAPVPGLPRPGLNLNKRSQALRMHRQGEPTEQIAASLELPRQEVELLLKVQRIVIANL